MQGLRVLLAGRDESLCRIFSMVGAIPGVEVIGAARSVEAARRDLHTLRPDIFIANVSMPDGSGLDIAPLVRDFEVIFVAPDPHAAADAFTRQAMDYLIEPVDFERLRGAVERIIRYRQTTREGSAGRADIAGAPVPDQGLWIQRTSGAVFVPINTISWIEAHGEYVMLHTAQHAYLARLKMNELEPRLAPHNLVRVHRSSMVQLADVIEFRRDGKRVVEVLLRCGTRIRVSAKYTLCLREQLAKATLS
jgi:DNA-binding LytR/AlgR family response regulator